MYCKMQQKPRGYTVAADYPDSDCHVCQFDTSETDRRDNRNTSRDYRSYFEGGFSWRQMRDDYAPDL